MAETFGHTTKGAGVFQPKDILYACLFTSGSAGELKSIKAYIKARNAYLGHIKFALYDASKHLVTNGTTEEHDLVADFEGWLELDFPSRPSVTATTEYYLAVWSEDYNYVYYDTGDFFDQTKHDDMIYGSWPDPFIQDGYEQWKNSIHAVYYEAPPPAKKTLVQAALISIPPLLVLPTVGQILKITGGC